MKDYRKQISSYIEEEIQVMQSLDIDVVNAAMNVLESTREKGHNIYICGNGGSAATASHFVCDFNKGVSGGQEKKYNFVCLNDNIATMLAIANDINYDSVFEYQLRNKIKKGDVFIGISGSGNSKNVLLAARYAKRAGATVIAITGYNGGELMGIGDISLHVPIDNMQITEDIHMMYDHMMMYILARGDRDND